MCSVTNSEIFPKPIINHALHAETYLFGRGEQDEPGVQNK